MIEASRKKVSKIKPRYLKLDGALKEVYTCVGVCAYTHARTPARAPVQLLGAVVLYCIIAVDAHINMRMMDLSKRDNA